MKDSRKLNEELLDVTGGSNLDEYLMSLDLNDDEKLQEYGPGFDIKLDPSVKYDGDGKK